jgi:NADH dehydrogenase (ubiquinone) Fe-S protein 1
MEKKIDIWIDGKLVSVNSAFTIMQACLSNQVEIPRFCYHDQLSVAGNCRMCLVEVEKSAKLVASCAMPILAGMSIMTQTSLVKRAREGVLEFLLINHPLDCPICDQGGECDLQDQAMVYGSDRGRFYEFKRSVKDKQVGPLIKTIMTRCIHCTRCVRFASEIALLPELGTSGRGGNMEITTYVKKLWLETNLSGNVVDLCPVGALTSKPYAFKARPWELRHTETIDTMDAFGSSIRVDSNGFEIVRVLPVFNPTINGEWISDKTRYSYDGFKKQRLLKPLLKKEKNAYSPVSWSSAIKLLLEKCTSSSLESFVGDFADVESMWMLKTLHEFLGSGFMYSNGKKIVFPVNQRSSFLSSTRLSDYGKKDFILAIHTDLDVDAPLLRLKFKKDVLFYTIGDSSLLKFSKKNKHVAVHSKSIIQLIQGKHSLCSTLLQYTNPAFLLSACSAPWKPILDTIAAHVQICSKKKDLTVDVLHLTSHQVGANEIGYSSRAYCSDFFSLKKERVSRVAYLLGCDDFKEYGAQNRNGLSNFDFIVYQGSHGDVGAQMADLILPGLSPMEKSATFLNTEGRVQKTFAVTNATGSSDLDSSILSKILYQVIHKENVKISKKEFQQLLNPIIESYSFGIFPALAEKYLKVETSISPIGAENLANGLYAYTKAYSNYYETNSIARASDVMNKCSLLKRTEDMKSFIS